MNDQQEYEQFLTKLFKAAHDVKKDFNKLSPENQKRVLSEANGFLRMHGYKITVEEVMRKHLR